MTNATHIRSEQQIDLLQQLEKVGAPIATTSSASLETLKSNSPLVEDVLGFVKNGESYAIIASFNARSLHKPTESAE